MIKYLLIDTENMSTFVPPEEVGGKATLSVLDIFKVSDKFILNSMNGKIKNIDSTVLKNSPTYRGSLQLFGLCAQGQYCWFLEGC